MIDAIGRDAGSIKTVEEYKEWTRRVIRPVFPHKTLASGFGHMHAGGVALDYLVTIDFPAGHIEGIRNVAGAIDTPILRRWLATQEPQLFEADYPWPDTPASYLACFRECGIENAAAHAVYDAKRCFGTYHTFHRIPGRLGAEHAEKLRQIVPVMHDVFSHVMDVLRFDNKFAAGLAALSAREAEIAHWVKAGRSNSEIAGLSGVSENTVKHHLTNIFGKLGVETRAQLAQRLAEHEAIATPGFLTKIV